MQIVNGGPVDYLALPERHRKTVEMYIEHGYEPGGGWRRILAHDLWAVIAVDPQTAAEMPALIKWLHNCAPAKCHGSVAEVQAWMEARTAERRASA